MLTHRKGLLSLLILAGGYIGAAHFLGAGIVDDAYIFLRYARNIWTGAGPVFNIGDPVEGYTSPLWLAVLTLGWPVSVEAERLATGLSAVVGLVLISLLVWRESCGKPWPSLVGAAFLATNPPFVFWAWSGMDTALFTLLLLASILTFEAESRAGGSCWKTGAMLAVAALGRLEALWLLPLFAAFMIVRASSPGVGSRRLMMLLAPIAALLGAHVAWRLFYYGDWLPNTFAAKVGVPLHVLLWHGLTYVVHALRPLVPLGALLALLVRHRHRQHHSEFSLPVLVGIWWIVYVFLAGGDHFPLSRFLVPLYIMLGVLLTRIAACFARTDDGYPMLALVAVTALGVNTWIAISPDTERGRAEVEMAKGWAEAGRWCEAYLPSGAIATNIVGAIPFYCGRETLDLLGLVDRHVARVGRIYAGAAVGHQKYATDYILSRRPRYIILPTSGRFDHPILEDADARARLSKRTHFAVWDLLHHPTVIGAYHYRAEALPNGTWFEFLERSRGNP